MRCIGLDVASKTGFAYGDHSGRPVYGVFKLPPLGEDSDALTLARALASLYGGITALVRENSIEAAMIEAPLPDIHRTNKRGVTTLTSRRGSKVLMMMYGVTLAAAKGAGCVHVWQVQPSVWRKGVLGNGYPENPKRAAIDYCRLAFKCEVIDDNAADAICLWAYGLGQAKLL